MSPLFSRRRLIGWSTAVACLVGSPAVNGQSLPLAAIRAIRTSQVPTIDGRLNDDCWTRAEPSSNFVQRDPDEGMPATERTEIRILYDDDALYIAARLFDRSPELVGRRLSDRDGDREADRFTIFLDGMHDRLTGAAFGVTAANVQEDAIISNDTFQDSSWDAVWQSQVDFDDRGWSVEMRIPLSQLRFPVNDRQTWGVNAERYIHRKNETAWLEMVPKTQTGLASRMADLTGLDGLRPRRHLEILPYTSARAEFLAPTEVGDPFNDGSRAFGAAGMDVKWGVTSNLALTASINPDFGQVEVDPAVVNLTAFETFFQEKRPFFLEGAQVFANFGQGGSNSFWGFNTSDPSIFYSRRIGRAPQLSPDADFMDSPSATTILGAVKLTGKTGGGWTLGFLNAVTDGETARLASDLIIRKTSVEPLSNYAVARMQRELGKRGGAGVMATAVTRRLDTTELRDKLVPHAYVVGTDGHVFLDSRRDWVLTGKISGSHVSGSTAAVEELQRAPQRYFQRPDAPHVRLDPTRASLTGWAGRVNLNRNSGVWQVNAALWGVSPGFESNDLGFHGTGDRAGAHAVLLWRGVTPNRFSRSRNVWVAKAWTWNFNREVQNDEWHGRAAMTFLNYWNANIGGGMWRATLDDRLTRGGPSVIAPAGGFANLNIETDPRRWLSLRTSINRGGHEAGNSRRSAGLFVTLKPSSMFSASTGPEWTREHTVAQYVDTETDPTAGATHGERYVFGRLERHELSLTTRVNLVLSPTVSLRVFAQPLISSGQYQDFKELGAPRTFDFLRYGMEGRTLDFDSATESYRVDPDGSLGAAAPFSFDDPAFNLRSLRVNAVFRWEFKPGSSFYAVWTRQQEDTKDPGPFALGRDARRLWSAPGDDVFLVKFAYWIGR
jgi:hypothetical protein